MKIIRTDSEEFEINFRRIRERGRVFDPELWAAVGRIVEEVGRRGDEALFEYTARWDGHVVSAATVETSVAERTAAVKLVAPKDLEILRLAAGRISHFHENQRQKGWSTAEEEGVAHGAVSRAAGGAEV
jgi:histidinol dehydrogenase